MSKLTAIITTAALTATIALIGAQAAQASVPTDTTGTYAAHDGTRLAGRALYDAMMADPTIPACEYEDGSEMLDAAATADPDLDVVEQQACKWDAGDSGNGVGSSFVVILTPLADGGAELVYVYADGSIWL